MNHCFCFETNYSLKCGRYPGNELALLFNDGTWAIFEGARTPCNQRVPIRDYLSFQIVKQGPHVLFCQVCLLCIGKHQQLFLFFLFWSVYVYLIFYSFELG